MLRQPRDYQIVAHNALWDYLETRTGNPVVAMPTGTGKGTQIAMLINNKLMRHPMMRFMMLTHVQELIGQDADDLLEVWPEAPFGIYSAGLQRRDTQAPIIIGGVASVANKLDDLLMPGAFDFLLIDEAHLLSPNGDTMYQTIIKRLKERNPNLRVVGFTATPYRQGLGLITSNGIFDDIVVDMTTMDWYNWFIAQGYLSKPVTRPGVKMLDVSNVGLSGGDFNGTQLTAALAAQDKEHIEACRQMVAMGQDRRAWLIFTAGIERAEWVSEFLQSLGVNATAVHSKMDATLRRDRIKAYRAGEYQAMVGNNVFTTGFNYKPIDMIGMLRPTTSPGLWVQMLGRGTRPVFADGYDLSTQEGRLMSIAAGGKLNCLVLDFAGNTERLGPVNDPVLPHKKGKPTGEIPAKICPVCGVYQHLSARICDNCGTPFEFNSKITKRHFQGAIVRGEEPVLEWFSVQSVIYREHRKEGSRPCVRVTYNCGFRSFEEWLFPESDKHLASKARAYWNTRVNADYKEFGPPPNSHEFVIWSHVLKRPKKIQVQMNANGGKYPEIQHYEYE